MSVKLKTSHNLQSEVKSAEQKTFNIRKNEPFHRKLTDVGLYSFGGLASVSLMQLFDEDCHRPFKKKALEKILIDLGQPKQTNDSMFAILEGEILDDGFAFVDTILREDCLQGSNQPLVVDLITLAISDGCYDARMRMFIKHVAWQLRVTWDEVEDIEADLAETLEYNTYVMSEEEAKEKAKKLKNTKLKRYALIGLATVGGGALIGLTGGLAAPLVAAGAGAIIGGAGAAALGSAAGVAIIGSLFGVAGAGLTGFKMKRRIGAIEEFSFEPLTLIGSKFDMTRTVKQLHITIAITGWINDEMQDFRRPWSALAESKEQYSLRWESKYLRQLGEAFEYIVQTGVSVATTEALKYTVLAGIITAIAWPAALIAAAGAIDNPWHVCTRRATETGKQLAEVLLAREQGNRPVTLVGFSLGARVIFSCLEELSKRKGGEGLIEDVILLGAPVPNDPKQWSQMSKVVAGKIVNGYARGDWLLKFLYRTASVTLGVAGLGPVKWTNRRMHNIDLSDIIDGHFDYAKQLFTIMKAVGLRTKDEVRQPKMSKSTSSSSRATTTSADDSCQTDDLSDLTSNPTNDLSDESHDLQMESLGPITAKDMSSSSSSSDSSSIGGNVNCFSSQCASFSTQKHKSSNNDFTSTNRDDTKPYRTRVVRNMNKVEMQSQNTTNVSQHPLSDLDNGEISSSKQTDVSVDETSDINTSINTQNTTEINVQETFDNITIKTKRDDDNNIDQSNYSAQELDSTEKVVCSNINAPDYKSSLLKSTDEGMKNKRQTERMKTSEKGTADAIPMYDLCDFTDSNPTSEDEQ